MFCLVLMLLLIASPLCAGGVARGEQDAEGSETDQELIATYTLLGRGRADAKIALLDRLNRLGTDNAIRFIAHVMETGESDEERSHAFALWAPGHTGEIILDFLESKRRSSRFHVYLPVIATIESIDRFAYLKELYDDNSLTRIQRVLFAALAALDTQEAFSYLAEQWWGEQDPMRAYDFLPLLLAMKHSWSSLFLDRLLGSKQPYGRRVAAERLIEMSPTLILKRIEGFMRIESHAGVRAATLRALARVGSVEAAGVILRAGDWQPWLRLFEVVAALESMPPEAVKSAIPESWLERPNSRRFLIAVLVLSRFQDRSLSSRLKKSERADQAALRIVAAVSRGRLSNNKRRIESIIMQGKVEARWDVLDVIQAFHLDDKVVVKKVLGILDDNKAWELQIKAAAVAAALGLREALPLLSERLESRRLLVRIAAIKALGQFREVQSIEMLLERLSKEEGRALWEIARSLKHLSGKAFGIDETKWRKWWKTRLESPSPLEGGEGDFRSWYPEDASASRYSFYGISIDSHNIVFVIDVSGSMAGPYFPARNYEPPIERLRKELAQTIRSLSPEHAINMVSFNAGVRRWRKQLVPLGGEERGNKSQALSFASYLKAEGNTNLYGGLDIAMRNEEVDALVLLSDGDPTNGKIVEKNAILEAVLKRNRTLQAKIHVIALGKADRAFLKKLARSTGGTFKSLETNEEK